MLVSNRIGIFILVGTFSLISILAQAQEHASKTDHQNFSVTTSISLGFSGPSYTTQFRLVDELGLEYDVMSLVEDSSIRQSLNLTEEQYGQMLTLKKTVTTELQKQLASALITETGKEAIKARFNEVEGEIRSILEPEQLFQLERVKIQRGIERFGLPEFLGTSAMKKDLGLTETELTSLKKTRTDAKSEHEHRIENLLEHANLALIDELSEANQKKMKDLLSEESTLGFLESTLFVGKKSLRHRKPAHIKNQLGLLRIKRVRESLELNDAQFKEIQAINKQAREMNEDDLKDAINKILTREQVEQLNQQVVKKETSRYGTVNELSYGLLSMLLELTSGESEEIFEAGRRISNELTEDVEKSKNEFLLETINSLSSEKRDRIIELIGKSVIPQSGSRIHEIR